MPRLVPSLNGQAASPPPATAPSTQRTSKSGQPAGKRPRGKSGRFKGSKVKHAGCHERKSRVPCMAQSLRIITCPV
eukprot:scaffold131793_cov18-Tisochrysis_lutea.AAC.3